LPEAFLSNIFVILVLEKPMAREGNKEIEKMRKLAELKLSLEQRIREAEADLESSKILLEFVSETLLEKGFKRAEILKAKPVETFVSPPVKESERVVPLKTATGDLLANLHMNRDSMHVTIVEGKTLNAKTPPFHQFLVERVLKKMQEKDSEAANRGEFAPEKILSYELFLDGDIIRKIKVKNVTPARLRELKSSIHWTLEKMYEKSG